MFIRRWPSQAILKRSAVQLHDVRGLAEVALPRHRVALHHRPFEHRREAGLLMAGRRLVARHRNLVRLRIEFARQAHRLLEKRPKLGVDANEASTLFSKLCGQLLIEGMEFRDSRATTLTLMARKMDILTLAIISRHRNLDLLRSTYYRETAEDIAARL